MEKWEWTDNFWKGRKRYGGTDVDFNDPRVRPFKAQLIAEGRIVRKKYQKKSEKED